MIKKIFFSILLVFVCIDTQAAWVIQRDRDVPYVRQVDYAEFGLSACGPSSISMILNYHFPNAHVSPGQIYHSGTQIYGYNGPLKYYRNIGSQDCLAGFCIDDTDLDKILDEGKDYYTSTSSSGSFINFKTYLENYWDATVTRITCDYLSISSALQDGPLLANVRPCGKNCKSCGHYLVVHNVDDNGTPEDESDDLIVINDPEPNCSIYNQTRTGENKKISISTLLDWLDKDNPNGLNKITFNSYIGLSKKYTVLVDSAHTVNDGYYNQGESKETKYTKYCYTNLIDPLDKNNTERETLFHTLTIEDESIDDLYYYYQAGKDAIFLNPNNPNNNNDISRVVWEPKLTCDGLYEIKYIFYDYGANATIDFKLKNSEDVLIDSKNVTYENLKTIVKKDLWKSISLKDGYYVEVVNVPKDVNIDALRFTYRGSFAEKLNWFFNNETLQGWSQKGFEQITYEGGWLHLSPSSDPQLISPFLSIDSPDPGQETPETVDLIQIFGRNNSQDNHGKIFIKTDTNSSFTPEYSLPFTFPNDNRWHLIQINVHDIPGWNEAKTIHGIRIDPIATVDTQASETIYIDYIRLRKKKAFFNNADQSVVRWHPDGTFIKSENSGLVYLIERGLKRPIHDGSIFEAYSYDWTNIITVSDDELNCFVTGDPLPLPMSIDRVIKRAGVDENGTAYPKVYFVTGNDAVKRHIVNEEVASSLGIDLLTDVEEVSETELNWYADGPDVTTIYPEGTIIKDLVNPGVYIISNGEARLFASQVTYEKLGYSTADDDGVGIWDSVIEVKSLPQTNCSHLVDEYKIYQCGAVGGCIPVMVWPQGGEILTGGTARETTYSIPNTENISNVVFSCTVDGYVTEQIINTNAPKNSVQTWHIPNVATDKASVQITAYDLNGRPYAVSPERFITIVPSAVSGQDYFDIYNDGGIEIKVTGITLENNSEWVVLNNGNPLPPEAAPLIISANGSFRIQVEVDKSALSSGQYTDTIHVSSDDPDFPDVSIDVKLNIQTEYSAPGEPLNPIVTPASWSGANTLSVQWTAPDDPSGIVGGYYKIGSAPEHDTDGIYFDIAEKPLQIPMLSDGSYDVYIWLKDGAGNVYYNNCVAVTGLRDTTPPQIIQLSPSENAVDIPIHSSIACSVSDQFSGVDTGNLTMTVNGTAVTPQEVSVSGDSVWIEYQSTANFNFNETVEVSVRINDISDPVNFTEKGYTFSTFSADGDADGDNLSNTDEYSNGTDPLNSDSDSDGMPDGWEVDNGLDPSSGDEVNGPDGDIDGDGLSNLEEYSDGLYYSAESAIILDAPTGTLSVNDFSINIGGNGVVAYKYRLNGGFWQSETPVDNAIELADLSNGSYLLEVIGKDVNGYWQSSNEPTSSVWDVAVVESSSYTMSNGYIYLSGSEGYIDQLQFDPTGSGNYGQNIIKNGGSLDWMIDGVSFSRSETTIQIQEQDRLVLNNQAGALWDIRLSGASFTSSLNLAYEPTNVQIKLDMPYEDSGYFDYATRYHWELGNDHEALDIPFKTFYSQTGNTRTIEYFMRNPDTGHYLEFRTNNLGDPAHIPATGNNRLVAIGTGNFDIDFNNLPSHRIWMEKNLNTLSLCSGQDTTLQTVDFDFQVADFNDLDDISVNEHGDKMPYFYTSADESVTNVYGGEYSFDELLNRFYRQAAFFYTDVGLNIWWNWATQYTGFVNNWYRSKLRNNLISWHQGDDGYGHPGYMWTWGYNAAAPDSGRGSPVGGLNASYDTRHLNTNALYIQAVWNYFSWTGDYDFLNGQLQRVSDAMQYQQDWLGAGSEDLINGENSYDSDHGGIHNEDVLSNYWDLLPFGGLDAYASIDYYNSLLAMAQIHYALGNTIEGDDYTALADQTKIAYNDTFWSALTDRYVGAIDRLGAIHDYGFTFVNIQALEAGLADSVQAEEIISWLDSSDIYSRWVFAPRTCTSSTLDNWRRVDANREDYGWELQLQDGGANLYVSGYDVIARAQYCGADIAYARLREILTRYSEPDKLTGGSPTIFNETIQGGNDGAGSIGVMSHEFPESGVVGSAFLYAFVGLKPMWDGLHIEPDIPSNQAYIGAKNIDYHRMNLNLHITGNSITIECTKNESVGEKYYVIDGVKKVFPSGTFILNEAYDYQPDSNGDGDIDGLDLQVLIGVFATGGATEGDVQAFALGFGR